MPGQGGHEVDSTAYRGRVPSRRARFLDQLTDALRLGELTSARISRSAIQHGHELLRQGFTVSQVVHDYGDVCHAMTELAVELDAPISTDDFRALNRCLDDAIAGAVTECGRERSVGH